MEPRNPSLDAARRTILLEADALQQVARQLTPDFDRVLDTVLQAPGRLIVSGIGKSALVAQKIVATLNSTGTPAVFLHAADAIHGDLGMILSHDVVLILSKSGDTPEIKVLAQLVKSFGNPLIALVGNTGSYLALQADFVLNTTVSQEACPNNLAPTASTTAQMVMGDALAVALMERRGFSSADFARVHPGGALGKKLYLRVADLYIQNEKPLVQEDTPLRDVIMEISAKRLGMTAVLDAQSRLAGIITDGDLRRMLERQESFAGVTAAAIMTRNPRTIATEALAIDALELMRKNNITQLPVLREDNYAGVIHLHDLIKEGLI
ncbi:MAG TPA: KpsF/GutQ family sugar-phosphate isomerase [Lacibacter sp.]|nr:KpsF/GutQ family sugar-phosphate isomerase [Lacibacter sp.]HMO88249.1 KpsF/GutQ family sugar-phosphate isomerase [Lacibacter sp.]